MLSNSISGVIFDLDGRLADTSPDIATALKAVLREAGQTRLPVPHVITTIGDRIPTLVESAQSYMINESDQFSARVEYRAKFSFSGDKWNTSTQSELIMTCDPEHFFRKVCISAFEDGTEVFVKNWDTKIPTIVYSS